MRFSIQITLVVLIWLESGCSPSTEVTVLSPVEARVDILLTSLTDAKGDSNIMAVAQLKSMGTNALPFLLKKLKEAGRIEKTNAEAASLPKFRIQKAFEVLGDDLTPLLSDLATELRAGRNPGNAAFGLTQIGREGGFILVQALTNTDVSVRASAAHAISHFENDSVIANLAVNPLLQCLNDNSAAVRCIAASSLGVLEVQPNVTVPALLQKARSDADFAVRANALKAIAHFGTNALLAEDALEELSISDKDPDARNLALKTLQEIKSN